MSTQLVSRTSSRPRPGLDLHPDITLPLARVHEACGPARRTFAMWLAGRTRGPVLWITPTWGVDTLNPDGMLTFADPARFIFVGARRAEDLLWCTEEALRAGATPLVVADLPGPPALTPVRRMHLAAQTGAQAGIQGNSATGARTHAPLGLLLTPGDGGAQGVETRWHMSPTHTTAQKDGRANGVAGQPGTGQRWRLERRRARVQPPKNWQATLPRTPRTGLELTGLELTGLSPARDVTAPGK